MGAAILAVFAASLPSRAAFEDVETTPRASGMAGAYAGQAEGVGSLFYNPAGLAFLGRPELTLSIEKLYQGLTDGDSLGRNVVAFGSRLRLFGRTRGSLALGINQFSAAGGLYKEDVKMFAYSHAIGRRFAWGLGVRMLGLSYGSDAYTAVNPLFADGTAKSAMGFDAGFLYRGAEFDWGLSIANANEPDVGIKYPSKVGRRIALGFSFPRERVTWNVDAVRAGNDIRLKTGGELKVARRFALRGGLAIGQRDFRNAAFGLAFQGPWFSVDYGILLPLSGISGTLGSHRVGLTLGWGRGPQTARPSAEEEAEEAAAAGPVAPSTAAPTGPVVLSPQERAQAKTILQAVRDELEKGKYDSALKRMQAIAPPVSYDEDIAWTQEELQAALDRFGLKELDATKKRDRLILQSITNYLSRDNLKALDSIAYALQLMPKDANVKEVHDFLYQRLQRASSEQKLVPGMDLLSQKLQEALEMLYDGKYVAAVFKCKEALALDPESVAALTRLGSTYWAMGDKKTAREVWKKALQQDPGNEEIRSFMEQQ